MLRMLVALVCWMCVAFAWGHDLALSGIRIDYRAKEVRVTVTMPISRLVQAEGGGRAELTPIETDLAIRSRLRLAQGGKPVAPADASLNGDIASDLLRWEASIPIGNGDVQVLERLFPEDPSASTIVTIWRDGELKQQIVLEEAAKAKSGPELAWSYMREGMTHIWSGPDHIAFLVGLLLLGGSFAVLLRTVTAFTIAHSITLSLAVTGVLTPSPLLIEPLIALSIVAIAVENLRKKPTQTDHRPLLAFGFGLIHGFGFAGGLSQAGLPPNGLALALATFNIGVEVGQAAVVIAVAPLIAWFAQKQPKLHAKFVVVGSVLIAVMGVYWFCARI